MNLQDLTLVIKDLEKYIEQLEDANEDQAYQIMELEQEILESQEMQ